jgi:hypothetical protein
MSEKRYVIAYGDCFDWRVEKAPASYGDNLLTRAEAARRIIEEADALLVQARDTRRRAMRVLRAEQKKSLLPSTPGATP